MDLSAPEGASVNDGIDPEMCSLHYITVDDVAGVTESVGWGGGANLAKVDIKSAYQIIPVHPEDRALLGMKWEGALYVDAALPFGLHSAPKIFTSIADSPEWMLRNQGLHTCKVVSPGRSFLGRMFELLRGVGRRQQFVRLNSSFRSDLQWWHQFLEAWNGVAMLGNTPENDFDINLYTDASGSFGCGAWWREGWLQLQWPDGLEEWSIARKEIVLIVVACMV